jgi:ABC-type multidrug transport system ATPase subunit
VLRVAAGRLTPGDLVVFTSYASRTYKPLRDIARQLGKVSRSLVRADRVAEILATDTQLEDRRGAYSGGRASGDVELREASFSYGDGRPALLDISLKIPQGSRIAIVGPSGAGKSTLGALIARFYDPTSGTVSIDGRDARDCSLSWLREQVGFLLQDTVLFSGTVAANIAYASDAPFSEVAEAARVSHANGFIADLPAGYETELGPRGVGLSGGQRQRIGIARVLLRDPPILVLDEPTSGLDALSEAEVIDGLYALMQGRTTIVITHSIALARKADRVLVLEDGRIVEDGPPEQLITGSGTFNRLASSQKGRPITQEATTSPPSDPALPQMSCLLNTTQMRPILRRFLRDDQKGSALDDLRIARVRYDPGERVIVHYRSTEAGNALDAVATVIAQQNLGAKVRNPRFTTMATIVNGRSPGRWPVAHDPDIDAIIAWLPFDAKLPGLAIPPPELIDRLTRAGVPVGEDREPVLIGYKPSSRAVLRLGDQILKAYGKDSHFEAARSGLVASGSSPSLCAVQLRAEFDDLRLTSQGAVDGTTPPKALDVAYEAAAFLRVLQNHEFAELPVATPEHQMREANRHARLASVLVPELDLQLKVLIERLNRAMPANVRLTPAHGDFHVDQLIANEKRLTVIDFDEMCMAPGALDVATYAADVVRGCEEDLVYVHATLQPLCDGYGGTPAWIEWYLSSAILCRATRPFRAQTSDWPERTRAIVHAAEEALAP